MVNEQCINVFVVAAIIKSNLSSVCLPATTFKKNEGGAYFILKDYGLIWRMKIPSESR